ncbi:MAG: MBL fold metallo-hydrolase [Nanoarchaeota archaeon]
MKAKFWGVRGSRSVSRRNVIEYGGNTTCLEVLSKEGDVYIEDAGNGIVELGNDLMKRGVKKIKILISHDHWDHIQGFPFFVPAYVPGNEVDVYSGDKQLGAKLVDQNARSETAFLRRSDLEGRMGNTVVMHKSSETNHTKEVFEGQQNVKAGYFPVPVSVMGANIKFHDLKEYDLVENGLNFSYMFHNAHPGGMFSYKVQENGRTLVNTGDYEQDGGETDRKMIDWARNADALIIDAQYTPEFYITKTKGWGHSHYEGACRIAAEANVKRVYITHHDPNSSDDSLRAMESKAQKYMQEVLKKDIQVFFAKEGMEVEV